jgi:hypothetical protein
MKKLLCTILTFVMILSVFAVPVMAENSDEKHLNAKGNTIACLTWLATITGNNLENITYMPDSKTTAEEMAAYKKAALDAVKNPYQVTK